jgi:hypothetical protein
MLLEAQVTVNYPAGAVVPVCDDYDLEQGNHSPALATAYIDLTELDEALELFFDGRLDEVDPTRVNLPLEELVRGKPLISQLESADISAALRQLPFPDFLAINIAHGVEEAQGTGKESAYAGAIVKLAEIISKEI